MYSQGRTFNVDSSIFLKKNRLCSGNQKFVHYLAVSLSLYLSEPVSSQQRLIRVLQRAVCGLNESGT